MCMGDHRDYQYGKRSLIVPPREHGAWGMLLVPLLTDVCAGVLNGGGGRRIIPLSLAAITLFWLRTPL